MNPSLPTRILLLALAATMATCATNPVTGNPDFVLMSEAQEIRIGRAEDPKIRKQYGVYDDSSLQQYVNEIGQQLAKASHRPALDYHFAVLDSLEVNAFALPGGYIYVTRGILAYLNSEAELAAVLGHELGHVTARHSVRQLSAAAAASVGTALLQIFVPETQGALGDNLLNLLGKALLSGYGREHELEADRLGAEYLARAGYDPWSMVNVVRVLKNQESFDSQVAAEEGRRPRAYHGLFATHPDNDIRLQQAVGEATRFKPANPRLGREPYLRRLDNMVFGDSPSQGVVRGADFYHSELGLAMRFPQGWRIRNQPQNVVAISPREEALIDLRMAGAAQGSPAEVLRKRLRPRIGIEIRQMTINGLPAATAQTTLSGRPTRLTVVFLGKNAYVIEAQARTPSAFRQHESVIEASFASFREIADDERRLAQPLRLRVITAQAGTTFAALARNSPLGKHAEGYLRVINGLYPDGEPRPGELIKIVE